MEVFLLRHAKSAYDWQRWPTDDVRPLSPKGRSRQERVGRGLKNLGILFDEIWCSPYTRARETLEITKTQLELEISPLIDSDLVVWGDPSIVVDKILTKSMSNHTTLLVVGHNPNISDVAHKLTGEDYYMKTSDVVRITINNGAVKSSRYYSRDELMSLST